MRVNELNAKNVTVSENLKALNLITSNLIGNTVYPRQINIVNYSGNYTYTNIINATSSLYVSKNIFGNSTFTNINQNQYYDRGLLTYNNGRYIGTDYSSSFALAQDGGTDIVNNPFDINQFNGASYIFNIESDLTGGPFVLRIGSALQDIYTIYQERNSKLRQASKSIYFKTPYGTKADTNGSLYEIVLNIQTFSSIPVILRIGQSTQTMSQNTNYAIAGFTIANGSPINIGFKIDLILTLNTNQFELYICTIGTPPN